MRNFDEYLKDGTVRKITPDPQRASYLRIESERKLKQLDKNIKIQGVDDENANDYVEYCYNIIMSAIRAEMLDSGHYSSGRGAHEAAFATTLGLDETDLNKLDELRYFRNGILYYGKRFDKEYTEMTIQFTKKVMKHIRGGK